MKKLVVNKYKKTSTTKPYYYIAEDFKSNLYIGNDVNILNTTTAKLKFDYIFSIKDVNLVNLDLNNIYYNDYNLIIFKNGSYYEYIRDDGNSFTLSKEVKLHFEFKNIYIHEDNTSEEGILKIYLYGLNKTVMTLFIKLDNIKLNILDTKDKVLSSLEYRGITKVYNKSLTGTKSKQLYYHNKNINTSTTADVDNYKIDTNILNVDKILYKKVLKNLLGKVRVTDNYYYDVDNTHLRINLVKGLPIKEDINFANADNNFKDKNYGILYRKEFNSGYLDIPIDKDNLNDTICKIVDYELNFFITNKNKYDVYTCCLQIDAGGTSAGSKLGKYKIWLKPELENNIYYFKENIRNFLRLEELNSYLESDNKIKLLIYYNGKFGKELKLENIDSKNIASHNTKYLFNEDYKIYNVVNNNGINEYNELKVEPGKIFVSDISVFNILILSKNLQDNIIYKDRLHAEYIKLDKGEKYLEFSILNKIDNSINNKRLKIYKSTVILQNKPTKLRNILDEMINNLSYKELYKFYNNKQVKDNIELLGEKEINHLVKMYKNKKYEKLVNYLNEYKDTEKFPLIYNSLLLKLNVTEQLEFGKMFQVYTTKKEECKNNTLPNQLPLDSRNIKVETISIKQDRFRDMIKNDNDNKILYVEFGTYRDYYKINKIIKKTPADKINYRLVVIPLIINNNYSLSYDASKNKELYNLPSYLQKEMKNLNTSSVDTTMKEIIKKSMNDIYRKIENNYINNTENPENIYNKVIINTTVTYNNKLVGGNIQKQLIKGGLPIEKVVDMLTNHITSDNIKRGIKFDYPSNKPKVKLNIPKEETKDKVKPEKGSEKTLELSDKCTALNNQIDKLKNELEQTKNKLSIIDQNNLWANLLKDGNPEANFNRMQNNNNLSQEQKNDYKKINDYIVKIKNLEKEKYETKMLEEQKKMFDMYNKDLKQMDAKKERDINLMEENINNKLKNLETMSKQKEKTDLLLQNNERNLDNKNFEIQNLNKMLSDKNKDIQNNKIEIENIKKNLDKCNNNKQDYDKLKAEYDLREKKILELNKKISLINNKKKQETISKIEKINTRKKELNNLQIKEDIKNELKTKTKKIKKTLEPDKKIEKKCKGNMIDCLLKDEKIHTDYKNSFKLVKDAEFDDKIFKKKQNIPCIPRNDCNVCPKLSKGTPNSVKINTNEKVQIFEKYEKI